MKKHPWLWVVIANLAFIAGITTMVTVAVRNRQPEVPIAHGR